MDFSIDDEPYVAHRSPMEMDLMCKDINEKPAEVEKSIVDFRHWVQAQKHFTIRTDDFFLLMFLRMSKWDIHKAHSMIEKFCMYHCGPMTRDWMLHSQADISDRVRELQETGCMLVLPKRNPKDGCRVIVLRFGRLDFKGYSLNDAFKLQDWLVKIRSLDFASTLNGSIDIIDWSGVGLAFIKNITPTILKKFTDFLHEAQPHRIKQQHFLNLPLVIRGLMELYKTFVSDKIKSRWFTYGEDTSALLSRVDPSCLPVEYGGTAGTVAEITAQHRQHMDANLAELDKFSTMSYDPTLKPHALDEQLGAEGTFRKLQVD